MSKNLNPHLVASFDQELETLDGLLVRQFGMVYNMLNDAMRAVSQFDVQGAQEIIQRDKEVDALDTMIKEGVIKILALRSPLADDLRWVVTIQKVSGELERIGDLSKNICKRISELARRPLPEATSGLRVLGFMVSEQLESMQHSWIDENVDLAMKAWQGDSAVDALYGSMIRELLTHMFEDHGNITSCIHLLFMANNLERIGDHVTNIAEELIFRITGKKPSGDRPKENNTTLAPIKSMGDQETP